MSYSGSTAATPNPPRSLIPALSGPGAANSTSVFKRSGQLWFYNTSDPSTALCNAGYFTDGKVLGMQPGDAMIAVCASTESSTGHVAVVGVLGSTLSTGGFNLSTGGAVTSTFT